MPGGCPMPELSDGSPPGDPDCALAGKTPIRTAHSTIANPSNFICMNASLLVLFSPGGSLTEIGSETASETRLITNTTLTQKVQIILLFLINCSKNCHETASPRWSTAAGSERIISGTTILYDLILPARFVLPFSPLSTAPGAALPAASGGHPRRLSLRLPGLHGGTFAAIQNSIMVGIKFLEHALRLRLSVFRFPELPAGCSKRSDAATVYRLIKQTLIVSATRQAVRRKSAQQNQRCKKSCHYRDLHGLWYSIRSYLPGWFLL